MDSTLREKYLANEIFRIGDLVEDSKTGENFKILDRGSNYITVESAAGIKKKWLDEIIVENSAAIEPDFVVTESGQIKMFGYETKSFESNLSEFIVEQFTEFEDLYSKHQIVKLLDSTFNEQNLDRKYELLEKISAFYTKQQIDEPLLIEGFKSEIERTRLAQIIAVVAGTEVINKSAYDTIKHAVGVLRKKYTEKKQWAVLWPFFVLVHNAGISGIINTLPYKFDMDKVTDDPSQKPYDAKLTEDIIQLFEDNLDELVDSIELEDITETFNDEDYSEEFLTEEQLDEVLSYSARLNLGRKIKARETSLETKRERALTRGASTAVLMHRARRLANTMIKRRMFRKAPDTMTRQEKERFEKGAVRRKALIARLATRLLNRVRLMQTARIHASNAGSGVPTTAPGHLPTTTMGAS